MCPVSLHLPPCPWLDTDSSIAAASEPWSCRLAAMLDCVLDPWGPCAPCCEGACWVPNPASAAAAAAVWLMLAARLCVRVEEEEGPPPAPGAGVPGPDIETAAPEVLSAGCAPGSGAVRSNPMAAPGFAAGRVSRPLPAVVAVAAAPAACAAAGAGTGGGFSRQGACASKRSCWSAVALSSFAYAACCLMAMYRPSGSRGMTCDDWQQVTSLSESSTYTSLPELLICAAVFRGSMECHAKGAPHFPSLSCDCFIKLPKQA
jgi:hypothetical protein